VDTGIIASRDHFNDANNRRFAPLFERLEALKKDGMPSDDRHNTLPAARHPEGDNRHGWNRPQRPAKTLDQKPSDPSSSSTCC
jgi:hypothetical protein